MRSISSGDIYIAELPIDGDPHMLFGKRPVIILHNGNHSNVYSSVLAIPLGKNLNKVIQNAKYNLALNTSIDQHNTDLIAYCDKIVRIELDSIYEKVGSVNDITLQKIGYILSDLFGCKINIANEDKEFENKTPTIEITDQEKFDNAMNHINELTEIYKNDNSPLNKWKERLINGLIGFVFGIIVSSIFLLIA